MRIPILLAAALVAVAALPAVGQDESTVDLGRYAGPLRFEAADGGVLELGDGRRYSGVLEVRLAADGGLTLVNDIDIEAYVEGIAEMPAGWPIEALKAQAVAARTYAWFQATRDAFDGYDICDTTACQVFRGREVVETPEVGKRWADAVALTRGEVVLHENAPILARYFSTSGGHTFDNEDVFATSGAYPYLVGVPDPDDARSPLHRWRATFTREQFDAIALRGQQLPDVVPIAGARRVAEPDPTPDRVLITGRNGRTVEITAGELRDFLNAAAPNAFPEDFPGLRNDGLRRLPSTVPSGRYDIEVTETSITLDGSGWGHGVGMGQWGAMGKAERGLAHDEILAAYYNGLEPTTSTELPETIRVGLSGVANEVSIASTSVFTITAGDQVLVQRGLGTFSVGAAADRTLALAAPPGHGAPLVLSDVVASRTRPFSVEEVRLDVVTNKPVELALSARSAATGRPADAVIGLGVVEPGRLDVNWSLDGPDGSALSPGSWEVTFEAIDENGERATRSTTVEILASAGSAAPSLLSATQAAPETSLALLLGAAAGGTLLGLVIGRAARRRLEHGSD